MKKTNRFRGLILAALVAFFFASCAGMETLPDPGLQPEITGAEIISLLRGLDVDPEAITGIDPGGIYRTLPEDYVWGILMGPGLLGGNGPMHQPYVSRYWAKTTGRQPRLCLDFAIDTVDWIRLRVMDPAFGGLGLTPWAKHSIGPFVIGTAERRGIPSYKQHALNWFVTPEKKLVLVEPQSAELYREPEDIPAVSDVWMVRPAG